MTPRGGQQASATRHVLGALVLVLVAAVTVWGLSAERPQAAAEEVGVPGGVLRVDAVRGELLQHDLMPMPSGLMPDMTPDGFARIWVDLTLAATTGEATWEAEAFRLAGPSLEPVLPRRTNVKPVVVPAGQAATFSLQFQVPAGLTEDLELLVRGADGPLALDLAGDEAVGHRH